MAVRTIDEILESVKTRVGDSTEDADIEFIENISDTLNDLNSKHLGGRIRGRKKIIPVNVSISFTTKKADYYYQSAFSFK